MWVGVIQGGFMGGVGIDLELHSQERQNSIGTKPRAGQLEGRSEG